MCSFVSSAPQKLDKLDKTNTTRNIGYAQLCKSCTNYKHSSVLIHCCNLLLIDVITAFTSFTLSDAIRGTDASAVLLKERWNYSSRLSTLLESGC